jgi:hypothetical protein
MSIFSSNSSDAGAHPIDLPSFWLLKTCSQFVQCKLTKNHRDCCPDILPVIHFYKQVMNMSIHH